MENVLASIPFPKDMSQALIAHHGEKGRLLECVIALETGDFDRARAVLHCSGELYLEAVAWADAVSESLFPEAEAAAQPTQPGVIVTRTRRSRTAAPRPSTTQRRCRPGP